MNLWLLRHGEAQPRAAQDALRQLTDKGRAEASASAQSLREANITCMLVSPFVRAQQTADEVCAVLNYQGRREVADWITPDDSPSRALANLDAYEGENLLLVTHQMFVGDLAGLLVHGHRQQPFPMGTGCLLQLQGDAFAAGLMRLISTTQP